MSDDAIVVDDDVDVDVGVDVDVDVDIDVDVEVDNDELPGDDGDVETLETKLETEGLQLAGASAVERTASGEGYDDRQRTASANLITRRLSTPNRVPTPVTRSTRTGSERSARSSSNAVSRSVPNASFTRGRVEAGV